LPQSIRLRFSTDVEIGGVEIMFQGGFVGVSAEVWVENEKIVTIYPADSNELQAFVLSACVPASQLFQLKFVQSSDFYGRITVYMLNVLGVLGE